MPHSCPGVYKRINCIRKVSTRNAHGHHLKWDKKVNTIRAASDAGRPADSPKSIFCRASVLLTFVRALWEMCKWPIRPLNVMQNDLRATSDKNTRRHLTMVAKFADHNKRQFLQQEKSNRFSLEKEQLFFVHFLATVARLRHETS